MTLETCLFSTKRSTLEFSTLLMVRFLVLFASVTCLILVRYITIYCVRKVSETFFSYEKYMNSSKSFNIFGSYIPPRKGLFSVWKRKSSSKKERRKDFKTVRFLAFFNHEKVDRATWYSEAKSIASTQKMYWGTHQKHHVLAILCQEGSQSFARMEARKFSVDLDEIKCYLKITWEYQMIWGDTRNQLQY